MEIAPFFSIIIPAYNMEKYIMETLESVQNQNYQNYEVIIVDDGSTDTTFELCKAYAKKDCRFEVYHQKNQGPMMARKTALLMAKGLYCLFLDSDDCYEKKLLRTVYDFIQTSKCDMIIFNSVSFYKRKIIEHKSITERNEIWTSQRALIELLKSVSMYSLCAKAIKRTVINDAGQEIYRPINNLEDYLQSLYYIYHSKNIGILHAHLYRCRRRSNSLSSEKISISTIKGILAVQKEAEEFVSQNANITQNDIFNCHIHVLCDFMGYIYRLNQNNISMKRKIDNLKQLRKFEVSKKFLNKEHIKRIALRNRTRAYLFEKRYFRSLILIDSVLLFIQNISFSIRRMETFDG